MRGRLQNCMHRPPDRPPRHPQGRRGLQPRGRRRRTNFRAVWGELQRVMTMRRSFSAESAPFAGGADPFMISSLLTSYYREVWGNMMTLLEDCQNSLQLITSVFLTHGPFSFVLRIFIRSYARRHFILTLTTEPSSRTGGSGGGGS